ncbi:MAG: metallophosphoesterase [Planctomycetaceae bacterium]|nr:metallophosphoesterase [Planctomycetaceae bacterium]
MKIDEFLPDPVCIVPFLNAGKGSGGFHEDALPVHLARSRSLPDGVSAVVVTADLQGREKFSEAGGQPIRLLGEVLPQRLADDILPGLGLPNPSDIGIVLAGDFYTVPALDKRGGTGDVSSVWNAFAQRFSWVVGVAGNHDLFGPNGDSRPSRSASHVHFLDGESRTLGNKLFAGLGGIIGNPARPQRRTEDDYLTALDGLLSRCPDVLIMHDGPQGTQKGQPGNPRVNELAELTPPGLIIRGHAHWSHPVSTAGRLQILNVDARVVIIERC